MGDTPNDGDKDDGAESFSKEVIVSTTSRPAPPPPQQPPAELRKRPATSPPPEETVPSPKKSKTVATPPELLSTPAAPSTPPPVSPAAPVSPPIAPAVPSTPPLPALSTNLAVPSIASAVSSTSPPVRATAPVVSSTSPPARSTAPVVSSTSPPAALTALTLPTSIRASTNILQQSHSHPLQSEEDINKQEGNTKEQWVSMSRLERKRFQEKRRRLEFKEALDKLLESLLRHDEGFLKEAQIREARFSGRVINRPPNTDENSLFNRVEMVNQAIFTIERSARENEEMKQSISALRDGRGEPSESMASSASRLHSSGFHQGVGPLMSPIAAGDSDLRQLHQPSDPRHMHHHHPHGVGAPGGDSTGSRSLLSSQASGGCPKQPAYARSITANNGASSTGSSTAIGGPSDSDNLGRHGSGMPSLTNLGQTGPVPAPQDLLWLRQLELEGRRQQILSQQSIAQLQFLNNASAQLRTAMPGTGGNVNTSMGGGMSSIGMGGGMHALLPFLGGGHNNPEQFAAHLTAMQQHQIGLAAQQQQAGNQDRLGGGMHRPDEIPSELIQGGASSDIYVPASGAPSSST